MRVFLVCALASGLNPITRVAQLLEGLSKKVEQDGKAEQDLYDKYKCWCTKVQNSKSASIDSNNLRISELAAYIDDLTNGRVELTGERGKLEGEIKDLETAIADAEAMRAKEHEDFLAAKDEMDKAIAALDKAVDVMDSGTNPDAAAKSLVGVSSELKQALEVGKGFLSQRDVAGLSKVLDVPEVDWKKLNREATFKQQYTARSGKIQDILSDMLQTFTDNRNEAQTSEETAVENHGKLMTAKKAELSASKQALLDKAGENGARAESLAESEAEKTDLEGQNTRDTTFLADTKTACKTKADEWSERKRLRAGEVAAISQALGVLRSDDARDLFKKSFDNDSFLQLDRKAHHSRGSRALAMIRRTAVVSKDVRLSALATILSMQKSGRNETDVTADPFAPVISAIDAMITSLSTEEAEDLSKKDQCEKDRMENTQTAKMLSKKIDTNTETIDRLAAGIAAAEKQIEEIEDQITDLNAEKKAADQQRGDEAKEFGVNQADDNAAIGLISTAVGVLESFYQDEGLALVQKAEPFVAAGEAPTPPPSTWENGSGYGGAKGESNGIIAIMELIKQDIQKDVDKAKSNEETAISEHGKLCTDIAATIGSLNSSKSTLNGKIATDETSKTTETGTRTTNQGDLTSTLAFLKSIAPGCDFIAVNFDIRLKNRQAEMDGLQKAKAILEGASFE